MDGKGSSSPISGLRASSIDLESAHSVGGYAVGFTAFTRARKGCKPFSTTHPSDPAPLVANSWPQVKEFGTYQEASIAVHVPTIWREQKATKCDMVRDLRPHLDPSGQRDHSHFATLHHTVHSRPRANGRGLARAGFDRIPAVRRQDIYEIKSSLILQPGPAALTDGLAELQRIIERWASR